MRSAERKWIVLSLLSIASLLSMAVWFSASAVVPVLTTEWHLDDGGRAWLTMSVQVGFVVGALGSALLNLADRIPAKWLFSTCAILSGCVTALISVFADSLVFALPCRFLTGVLVAGVYPVGMKIIATWTKSDRGLGIGLLVGALAIGSASPHLLVLAGGISDWRITLYLAAFSAVIGGFIALFFISEGPYRTSTPPFNWHYVGRVFQQRELLFANLGYLGHMWELYAMWAWIPAFLLASFLVSGVQAHWAALMAFLVIGAGGLGSLLAGVVADKIGRTTVSITSLLLSGGCALSVGFLFGHEPWLLACLCLIWGFAVVADSAQFSAAITEMCQPEYTGTALTLQTSLGFLLTLVTIRMIPWLEHSVGWRWAFMSLLPGPAVGIWAMVRLRLLPASNQMAGGRK